MSDHDAPDLADEDSWRSANLELLSNAHSLGAVADLSFHVIESNYSDFAFELQYDTFQWRWETNYLGHKRSSEIISKQLIFPLISLNHMAFTSPQGLNEMSDTDIEKAVDRVGRTARRTIDTHIKHAISKPRVATAIRRMTAVFDFVSELPAVKSTAERPGLDQEIRTRPARRQAPTVPPSEPPLAIPSPRSPRPQPQSREKPDDSATEPESDTSPRMDKFPAVSKSTRSPLPGPLKSRSGSAALPSRHVSPRVADSVEEAVAATGSESSPTRPAKKLKGPPTDTEEDSEEERRKHLAQLKGGNAPTIAKRGVRQPIKRGGKRF
ncbi:hypothetical protein APHAL10511_007356 [Amanita phalloides]|nr:hypothetical protein APHAL10511_007356 [Amanita phalloides]